VPNSFTHVSCVKDNRTPFNQIKFSIKRPIRSLKSFCPILIRTGLISITITFPISPWFFILAVVITESFRTRHLVRNFARLKELFRSFTNLQSNQSLLRYCCVSCGNEHTKVACPKCGSKIKKVDF
jgi:uncharacterized paraquat-inducible protein A